jgi:glutamate racemase
VVSSLRNAPIGVFDSGIGGLTVVRAMLEQLPGERLIYFGDTARVPYGPKSPETVRRYSMQIAEWLVSQDVKAIVIACNTATAHALDVLRESLDVPVVGVVEPGARAAMERTRDKVIGVIGTAGTIASGAYERAIHKLAPDATVHATACPLFVPLVEEGWTEHEATRLIAAEYLSPMRGAGVDTLVLGCTHYPLLAPVIADVMGSDVTLIDSAEETARETARVLGEQQLQAQSAARTQEMSDTSLMHRFVASDAPDRVLAMGRRFLGDTIRTVDLVTFT